MVDLEKIVVSCSKWEEIGDAFNAANMALPLEERKPFGRIFSLYMAAYGLEGVFERMNNRSVSQILAEYQDPGITPIASGEVDGTKYELYGAPKDGIRNDDAS